MVLVALQSARFPNRYVRLDGTGVTKSTNNGGGTVNTQTYIGTYETYTLVENSDGTVSFKSTVFNNVFLRLDGSSVPPGKNLASGGGLVNAQFLAGPWEKYRIHKKAGPVDKYDGVVGLESFGFPGRYLRLDGKAGKVNVQGVFGADEEFKILVVGQ